MPRATATTARSNRKCSPSRRLSALVPVLALAISETQAFSPGSAFKRHGLAPNLPSSKRQRQLRTLRVLGRSHQLHKTSRSRPYSSKFFVASTTGRSLNNGNENGFFNSSEEEYPWECIIDPTCCDECLEMADHYQQQVDVGTWTIKEEPTDIVTVADKISMGAMGAAGIFAYSLLLMWSGPGAWRFFLAGGLCAAASHAIPTPIDVVKVGVEKLD